MKSLSLFEQASQELIASRALQDRVDTKFVLRREELDGLLSSLSEDFSVVASGSTLNSRYQNLYFDTEEYRFLRDHHRGRRPRFKVRIRHYLDRELSVLEIKEKAPTERTLKLRKSIPFMAEQFSSSHREFLDAHPAITSTDLHPSLRIDFSRITVVSKHSDERITFDTLLGFSHGDGEVVLERAVIAEIKQPRFAPRSPGMLALRQCGAMQLRISKYMTGAQLLLSSIRLQRYAPRMKRLRRRIA